MKRIYLDYAATTPAHPEVIQAMLTYLNESFGNPSSIHSYGQEAADSIEEARERIAGCIGAKGKEVIFTGSGTEADNLAIKGVAFTRKEVGNHIITTSVEHHAVIETCKHLEKRGFKITYLPVDKYGMVDPDDIKKAITDKTILISVMHANNEVGTIEPIAEMGNITRELDICFHTDAVQTVGQIPVDVNDLGVDLLSISAHKLYGPKGVGALYVREGTELTPFTHGGEQERGLRAGTENVPGIIGFAKAMEIARRGMSGEMQRLSCLRNKLIEGILIGIEHSQLNGHPTHRLPNNVNVIIEYVEGETLLLNLDLEGICASTGSACSSSNLEPSHVLMAMGIPREKAHSPLRLTLGSWTVEEDIEIVLEVLPRIVAKLRDMSPLLRERQQR